MMAQGCSGQPPMSQSSDGGQHWSARHITLCTLYTPSRPHRPVKIIKILSPTRNGNILSGIFRFLPRLVKYLFWPRVRREMWVLTLFWWMQSPMLSLTGGYYRCLIYYSLIITNTSTEYQHFQLMLHVMTSQTNQKFLTTGTNWGIPHKKLTCVLLSCLSGLLVNVKCVLLNHLFVIWQQHFSCYHKRVEIKRCWRFLFRAVLTRVPGFIDNLYTGVGTWTSQLCSQKKVINYWLEPSRQFPRIDNKSKGKLWGFEIGFLFSYLYLKCFWDMGWKSWDVKMMINNLSKNNGA